MIGEEKDDLVNFCADIAIDVDNVQEYLILYRSKGTLYSRVNGDDLTLLGMMEFLRRDILDQLMKSGDE